MRFPLFNSPAEPDSGEQTRPVIPPGATVVLIVEDDPAIRGLCAMSLRRAGYFPIEARNGAEALDLAQLTGRLDLVISDIVMPIMKGTDLAAKLREQWADLTFLFISGYLISDDLGANAHMLMKPFRNPDLLKKVHEVIGPPRPIETNDKTETTQ